MITDWNDAYANMAHVPGSEDLPDQWAADAAAYRESKARIETDIHYGDLPRQKFDLILPDGTPKGLAVFVHGGYWMKFDKSFWTHYAEGARASGWAVALPGYTLAPEARIADITQEIRQAVICASERIDGPIRLAGHSAGGHLVSRLVCSDIAMPCTERIDHVLSISGVHDLRPLLHTRMNETFQLDMQAARAESPALCEPREGISITAWVGGGERPEFIRQSELLNLNWQGFEVNTSLVVAPVHNHFTVIEGLKDPESVLTKAFVGG